jgi:polar amino acid transport system permease protein
VTSSDTVLDRPVIKAEKTFSQRMRDFPWWAVLLVIGVATAFSVMLRSEQYRDALHFIVNPENTTEVMPGLLIRTGIRVTLLVTVVSYLIALVLGLLLGIMRVSKNPILFHLSTLYVEVMRGVPMLVLILWIGFVVVPGVRDLTDGAFELSRVQGAIIGLGMGYAAYLAEVYRSGIESIHRGQMEAARSLGMNYVQAMRHVILPQAIRRVVPPLANDFVAMLKDSALVSVVAVPEILQSARLYVSRTFRAFEGYNSAALLYLVLTLAFIFVVRFIEGRWRVDG